jgi:hypothetical protein
MMRTASSDEIIKLLQPKLVDKPSVIDKTPMFCESPQDMQAGDILIFNDAYLRRKKRANESASASYVPKNVTGFFTKRQQALLNEPGGHMDSLHVGVVIEIEGVKKLAHLLGKGFQLQDLDYDSINHAKFLNTTTHIYRPAAKHREEIAAELTGLISALHPEDRQNKRLTKIKWAFIVAIRSVIFRMVSSLRIIHTNPHEKVMAERDIPPMREIANASICSKFVADGYISGCNNLTKKNNYNYRAQFMNISSVTLPKTLQAYLYRNVNYEYLVMPNRREELFTYLLAVIRAEIQRLTIDALPAAQKKAADLSAAIGVFQASVTPDDLMQKSILLLKVLSPILMTNTRGHSSVPTSYKNVMAFARTQGIYEEYLTHEFYDRRHGKITTLAQQHYHFTQPQAKIYSQYRHLGYSDVEAKFECHIAPRFGDWYKLSPARNILLTCSVIGFFCWVLPRGLSRAREVTQRNQALFATNEIKLSDLSP